MNVLIRDYHDPGRQPHPEAVRHDPENPTPKDFPFYWTLEITDLEAFCRDYGPVIVSPPGKKPCPDRWFIWTAHLGHFKQV